MKEIHYWKETKWYEVDELFLANILPQNCIILYMRLILFQNICYEYCVPIPDTVEKYSFCAYKMRNYQIEMIYHLITLNHGHAIKNKNLHIVLKHTDQN